MRSRTQHVLLLCLIGAIVLSGLGGVWVLVLGTFGWLEARVLITAVLVAAAAILGLASSVVYERGRRAWRPIGAASATLTGITLLLGLYLVWLDAFHLDDLVRTSLSIAVLAVALTHVGLLGFARLLPAWEWVRWVTLIAISMLVLLLLALIWTASASDDSVYRFMGILLIVALCGTLALPLLHRLTLLRRRAAVRTAPLEVRLNCPRCGRAETLAVGRGKCTGCGLGIHVEIEEEHCAKCGYVLFALESAVCPECGTPLAHPVNLTTHSG